MNRSAPPGQAGTVGDRAGNAPPVVALLSPGDMGSAVARVLIGHGASVVTCMAGRSERTRRLAQEAGITVADGLGAMLRQADIVLSIVPPAQALPVAGAVCDAARDAAMASPVYVDCNAVSPGTMASIAALVQDAGLTCVDAGIIGPPPRRPGTTRFYVSGPQGSVGILTAHGLECVDLGERIGAASGFKMCYAASTKGFAALAAELLAAAHGLGVLEPLRAEFDQSQPHLWPLLERLLPSMPSKAHRWVGEMQEIAACFEQQGLTPEIFQGVAAFYRDVMATPAAALTPEQADQFPSVAELARQIRAVAG